MGQLLVLLSKVLADVDDGRRRLTQKLEGKAAHPLFPVARGLSSGRVPGVLKLFERILGYRPVLHPDLSVQVHPRHFPVRGNLDLGPLLGHRLALYSFHDERVVLVLQIGGDVDLPQSTPHGENVRDVALAEPADHVAKRLHGQLMGRGTRVARSYDVHKTPDDAARVLLGVPLVQASEMVQGGQESIGELDKVRLLERDLLRHHDVLQDAHQDRHDVSGVLPQ
mmetsp:Transcript_24897/g.51706  ORF Transcript_24897/g.51706 Transcript_24897/m.51706 type:complete len:224 (-) Transcript_24897:573-1244(-)